MGYFHPTGFYFIILSFSLGKMGKVRCKETKQKKCTPHSNN